VLYSIAGNLWSYSLKTQASNLLANVAVFGNIAEIYPNQDGSYIYLDIQDTNTNTFYLTRLGLNKQPVSAMMQQLQVFLPNTSGGCLMGYLNFTKPSITVDNTGSPTTNCSLVAENYLQTYNINTSLLNFVSVD
jgi:hypothetical protein